MARTLWCRYADCGYGYASVAGDQPSLCPECKRSALWSREEPLLQPETPEVPFALTVNDRRLLRSLRIEAPEPE